MTVKMEKHTARKYSSPIRERQANQTRTNILDATQRLFLERGYAKTTVEAIAQEAGVAKQTVYAVFRSKNGIVAELLDRAVFTERVFELIAEELKEVTAEAFPEQLIAVTKEQMISNFIIGTESTLNRMTAAGASLLLRGEVQETEEVIAKIEAVTAADVLATARAVLDTEKISYSAVGNLKGNDFGTLVEKFFK